MATIAWRHRKFGAFGGINLSRLRIDAQFSRHDDDITGSNPVRWPPTVPCRDVSGHEKSSASMISSDFTKSPNCFRSLIAGSAAQLGMCRLYRLQ